VVGDVISGDYSPVMVTHTSREERASSATQDASVQVGMMASESDLSQIFLLTNLKKAVWLYTLNLK